MTYQGMIDTHAHYDDAAFDEDRVALFSAFLEAGIEKVINVGAAADSTRAVLELAARHDMIYAAVGVHPDEIGKMTEKTYAEIEAALPQPKVVAVGEIGLDYHWMVSPKEAQAELFKKQALIAIRHGLPILVHSRDAGEDTLHVLKELYGPGGPGASLLKKGVMHCYGYSPELALAFKKLGFLFGIGGVVTFKNGRKLKESVAALELSDLLLETDAPYLAPEPHRGQRNSSLYLPAVVDAIAEIKNCDPKEVIRATRKNAQRLFLS